MNETENKIIATWTILAICFVIYLFTQWIAIAILAFVLGYPIRKGLHEDDTLRGAISDHPLLGGTCLTTSIIILTYFSYRNLNGNGFGVSNENVALSIVAPLLLLYLYRDLKFLKNIRH